MCKQRSPKLGGGASSAYVLPTMSSTDTNDVPSAGLPFEQTQTRLAEPRTLSQKAKSESALDEANTQPPLLAKLLPGQLAWGRPPREQGLLPAPELSLLTGL